MTIRGGARASVRAPNPASGMMTDFRLAPDVSFGFVEDVPVFLDVKRDRYFRLYGQMSSTFERLCQSTDGAEIEERSLDRLVEAGVVVRCSHPCAPIAATCANIPVQSFAEVRRSAHVPGLMVLTEITLELLWVRRCLSRRRLVAMLETVRAGRLSVGRSTANGDEGLEAAMSNFLAARRLVPIAPNCLLDSLALHRFLVRRGIFAELIFAVRLDPFAAHCWLQAGNRLLNDSLDSIASFAPVLVVR